MNGNLKPALAELIGTFTLVFIGAGAGALGSKIGGVLGVALAHGVALMIIVYTWGAISGAHVNPAVTFGLAITGKIDWTKAAYYWVAQLVGAILAAYILFYLIPADIKGAATVGDLTTKDPLRTVVVEAILTFFLMSTIFATAVSGKGGNATGLAIGFVLTMDILMGGSLTGASMNPARTIGPALVANATGDLSYVAWYILGPLLGAGLAALLYDRVFLESKTETKTSKR